MLRFCPEEKLFVVFRQRPAQRTSDYTHKMIEIKRGGKRESPARKAKRKLSFGRSRLVFWRSRLTFGKRKPAFGQTVLSDMDSPKPKASSKG
jgi:hypothetical protein